MIIQWLVSVIDNDCESITVQIEAVDNGIGISKEQQKALFFAFEQLNGFTWANRHGIRMCGKRERSRKPLYGRSGKVCNYLYGYKHALNGWCGSKPANTRVWIFYVGRNTPIVAITANVLDNNTETYYNAGMGGHMGKPVDYDLPIEKVNLHI